jgi:hypothetical protein
MESNHSEQQNVTFIDEMPGDEHRIPNVHDSLRSAPMLNDTQLNDFFSRPVRIATYDWTVGATLNDTIYPWRNYFSDVKVSNRIANFKLLTADLCVKVVVNGNAFHYGRAMLSYTPFIGKDELTTNRAGIRADLVQLSQRPHVFIDPTTSQGACMSLPFTWWDNTIDTTNGEDPNVDVNDNDWARMGQLELNSINVLKHANGATDGATIDIFCWATNVNYSTPTNANPVLIAPQSLDNRVPMAKDEYTGGGVISGPATAVANFATKVGMMTPQWAPYTTATALAAKAVAGFAGIFGFSRPVKLESSRYQLVTKHNMASSNLEDDVTKLALDSKQEVTIDPSAYGLGQMDELDIKYIAGKESYINTFSWPISGVGSSPESLLWNIVVDPIVTQNYDVGAGTELHMPALAFAALPFNRWRGSIKYRFQVVCSKFHRGRLKVVYDPTGTAAVARYNTAYMTIVDISNTTDFEIVAGWGQPTTYRPLNDITNPMSLNMDTAQLPYNNLDDGYGNGTIAVYVVNELTAPNTTVDNDIEINVFVSGGDDIEFAMPTGERVTRMRLRDPAQIAPQSLNNFSDRVPMAEDNQTTVTNDSMGVSTNPSTADVLGPTMPTVDPANLMHFGESIRSFRQLLKRYNQHEIITPFNRGNAWAGNVGRLVKIQRPAMPFEPGYSNKSDITQIKSVPLPIGATPAAKPYAYATMPLMRYLSLGYMGWRGSIRYLVDLGHFGCGCKGLGPATVTRYSSCSPETAAVGHGPLWTNSGQSGAQVSYDDVSGMEGIIAQNTSLNGTINFEVPFYTEKRFIPARSLTNFDETGENNTAPCWKLRYPFFTGDNQNEMFAAGITTFVAAGEDFSLGFFIGAPTFYYEGIPPT